jgi:hypothetical protein
MKKGCDRVERVVKGSGRRGVPVDGFWVNLGWGEWARATTVVFSGPESNMIRWSAIVEKGGQREK